MDEFIEAMGLKLDNYTDEEKQAASLAAASHLISKWKAEANNERSLKEQAQQARAVAVTDSIAANERAAIAGIELKNSKFLLRLAVATFAVLVVIAYFRINFICR